ncbi:AI-2E family transporter [Stappia sp. GBMRC 2046]|uniref:AI-2E family transporter n=1 Tax=Stappia sediminis TaxID=2692190 RepID=A0A7X3LQW3_9HYPH|nr:AI-2E family transporter [Stappia sediminis]MXN63443.1 AI-2E family transporter [Stappia sediminis]
MPRSLATVSLALLTVTLIGWLLHVGRSLLLPFVIALVAWYLINTVALGFKKLPLGPFRLPGWVALPAALLTIFGVSSFVFDLVTANLTELAGDAPLYQTRLEQVFNELMASLQLQDQVELQDLLPSGIVSKLISAGASIITTVAGSASLVFIYVLFLLMEQSTFDRKLMRLFTSKERAEVAFAIRAAVGKSVRHYVNIKTAVSVMTGLLTSALLSFIGLPYAALFGFIAFLLNYIPTIGSLISVIFPSMLALVYFKDLSQFLIIAGGLGLIQFSIGNILEPRLMGTSLNLSGLVIMLSLAFWGTLWGVTGMVLCVPLTVLGLIVCAQFPATRPIAILLSADGEVGEPLALHEHADIAGSTENHPKA